MNPRFLVRHGNTVAYEKEDVELECKVYGRPEPTVHWLKNGELIIETEYFQVSVCLHFSYPCELSVWMISVARWVGCYADRVYTYQALLK